MLHIMVTAVKRIPGRSGRREPWPGLWFAQLTVAARDGAGDEGRGYSFAPCNSRLAMAASPKSLDALGLFRYACSRECSGKRVSDGPGSESPPQPPTGWGRLVWRG